MLDEDVELIGVEAAGEGLDSSRHSAPLTIGARGVLHGAFSAVLQDADGQMLEAHSVSAGLDYPGSGPEHAWLRDEGRVRYVAVEDEDAVAAFKLLSRLEGIIPALEPSHALAWLLANPRAGGLDALVAVGPRRQGPRRGAGAVSAASAPEGARRIAAAFSGHGKRAALMPYLMGGYPGRRDLARGGRGGDRGRRRPDRAGHSRSRIRSPTAR